MKEIGPPTLKLLTRLHRLTWNHPFKILILAFTAGAVCLYQLKGLTLESSLESLYPENSATIQKLAELAKRHGGMENLIVVIDAPDGDTDDLYDFAVEYRDELEAAAEIASASQAPDLSPDLLLSSPIAAKALMFLDKTGVDEVVKRLSDEAIRERARANAELLKSEAGMAATSLIGKDPLGISTLFLDRIQNPLSKLKIRFEDGVLFSEKGDLAVILARPDGSPQDIQFCKRLDEVLKNVERRVREETELPSIRIRYGGQYHIHLVYHKIIKNDLISCAWTSFVLVLLLYLIAFRSLGSVLIVSIPLALTMIWTLAFSSAFLGSLNALTGACIVLLIGLCIDFAVHLFHRFLEEREHHGPEESLHTAMTNTGSAVLAAAATTMVAFLALRLSDVRGLQELGLMTSFGMLLGLVSMFTVLPAFIAAASRMGTTDSRLVRLFRTSPAITQLHLGPVIDLVTKNPGRTLAGGVAVTILMLPGLTKLRFEDDLTRLRPSKAVVFDLLNELQARLGSPLMPVPVVVQHKDAAQAWSLARRVSEQLQEAVDAGEVSAFVSPASLLPPPDQQRSVLSHLRHLRQTAPDTLDITRVRRVFAAAYEENGLRMNSDTTRFIDLLERALANDTEIQPSDVSQAVDPSVWSKFVVSGPVTEIVTLSYASVADEHTISSSLKNVMDRMASLGDAVSVPGSRSIGIEIKRILINDFTIMVMAALIGVSAVVLLHFRNLRDSLFALTPLLVAVSWTLGLMGWLGIDLNLMNVSVIPLILGIGIDDGIQVVHRFRTRESRTPSQVIGQTGMALVMTSLTTIVAFGSLTLAEYPGLKAFGQLTTIGVAGCLMASLVLLPALLAMWHPNRVNHTDEDSVTQ